VRHTQEGQRLGLMHSARYAEVYHVE
jgi:hypothetical protein